MLAPDADRPAALAGPQQSSGRTADPSGDGTRHGSQRAFRVAESEVSNSDRSLHLLGLRQAEIDAIQTEPDTAISRYELYAPIAGRVIAKLISIGEKVEEEEPS